ncbi:hypothetical protein BaRGS_00018858 [Batillaria attramentaria]|uniref:Uncharacterized protein n=1 Tax=Batillaria attramentaria TaxID=370345 RepID=A0ABD0KRB4_9CAEN
MCLSHRQLDSRQTNDDTKTKTKPCSWSGKQSCNTGLPQCRRQWIDTLLASCPTTQATMAASRLGKTCKSLSLLGNTAIPTRPLLSGHQMPLNLLAPLRPKIADRHNWI